MTDTAKTTASNPDGAAAPATPDRGGDDGLRLTRIFDAPRERVFEAWTQPRHLAHWYGPHGSTTEVRELDLRPGGRFHFCMRCADGTDYWGLATYREVAPPERLVWVDSFADEDGNVVPASHYGLSEEHPLETVVTVTFRDLGGKTEVHLHHALSADVPEHAGTEEGWGELFERLRGVVEGEDG